MAPRGWRVKKSGPNHGKRFLACAMPRKQQCSFFRWVDDAETVPAAASEGDDAAAVHPATPSPLVSPATPTLPTASSSFTALTMIGTPCEQTSAASNKATEAAAGQEADSLPLSFMLSKHGRIDLQLGKVDVAHIEVSTQNGLALVFHGRRGRALVDIKNKASKISEDFLAKKIDETKLAAMASVVQQH